MATKSESGKPNAKRTSKRKLPDFLKLQDPPNAKKSPYFDESVTSSPQNINHSEKQNDNEGNQNNMSPATRLSRSFYDKTCIELAKQLLGQSLVRIVDGERISGRIVETEAYVGAEDSASHTFKGRKSASNKSMFLSPGHAYVYFTYGMYHCINITSRGDGQAVLLRALSPIDGSSTMRSLRLKASKNPDRVIKDKDLCNGPGKLCLSLDINRMLDGTDLTERGSPMWIESGDPISDASIVSCPRIGIDSATEEWVKKPLRFYVLGQQCVSKRNKLAETSKKVNDTQHR